MAKLKLSPPWEKYYHEINAMFEADDEVRVVLDEDEHRVLVYVENAEKASALSELLNPRKQFGDITVKVDVIPANTQRTGEAIVDILDKAFDDNPVVDSITTVSDPQYPVRAYVLFKKKVVQFFNDDLGDANGLCSTLYQEIAKDIFTPYRGVFYCTSPSESYLYEDEDLCFLINEVKKEIDIDE